MSGIFSGWLRSRSREGGGDAPCSIGVPMPDCYVGGVLTTDADGRAKITLSFSSVDGVEAWFEALTDEIDRRAPSSLLISNQPGAIHDQRD